MRARRAGLFALLALAGCATLTTPPEYRRPEAEQLIDGRGAWIALDVKGTLHRPRGELIAVSQDSVFVLDDSLRAWPISVLRSGRLRAWQPPLFLAGVEMTALSLLSVSNGWLAILTLPSNLVVGAMALVDEGRTAGRDSRRLGWPAMAAYARFPQGLPAGLERSELHLLAGPRLTDVGVPLPAPQRALHPAGAVPGEGPRYMARVVVALEDPSAFAAEAGPLTTTATGELIAVEPNPGRLWLLTEEGLRSLPRSQVQGLEFQHVEAGAWRTTRSLDRWSLDEAAPLARFPAGLPAEHVPGTPLSPSLGNGSGQGPRSATRVAEASSPAAALARRSPPASPRGPGARARLILKTAAGRLPFFAPLSPESQLMGELIAIDAERDSLWLLGDEGPVGLPLFRIGRLELYELRGGRERSLGRFSAKRLLEAAPQARYPGGLPAGFDPAALETPRRWNHVP